MTDEIPVPIVFSNTSQLLDELVAAGLPVVGVASSGRIDWQQPPTAEQENLARDVIKQHESRTNSGNFALK